MNLEIKSLLFFIIRKREKCKRIKVLSDEKKCIKFDNIKNWFMEKFKSPKIFKKNISAVLG